MSQVDTVAYDRHTKPQSDDRELDAVSFTGSSGVADLGRISVLPNSARPIQAKLRVNTPGDRYEQEADKVAEAVVGMPESRIPSEEEEASFEERPKTPDISNVNNGATVQRLEDSEEEEEEELLQAKFVAGKTSKIDGSVSANIQSMRGGGEPLSMATRDYFEPRFGVDFSKVRVHRSKQAADTAKSVNARAFTVGQDLVFGDGQYAPDSQEGKRLLAHELTHVVQQGGGQVMVQRDELTDEETTEANEYNDSRFHYTAPDPTQPDIESPLQGVLRLLHNVAQDDSLFQAASADTFIGDNFADLVNVAQEQLFPGQEDLHDGQLGPGTLKALMAAPQNAMASTAVGIGGDTSFISEGQVSAPYSHFSSQRLGDFRVTGGFMEPAGHGNKGDAKGIFAEQYFISDELSHFDMAKAIAFNASNVGQGDLEGLINDLHTLVQDDALRDEARAENTPGSMALARLTFAAQVQLFPSEANLDGQLGAGTQTALTQRIREIQNFAAHANPAISNADAFVHQLAPMTEAFESREPRMYLDSEGIPTVGVGFNLQRGDAQERINAVGANFQNVLDGTDALTDDQINALFFDDLENIGVDAARDVVNNFDQLPLMARLILADMGFNLGRNRLGRFANMIAAFEREDFHAAADEMVNSRWFNQVGRRGEHHVSAIRFLATRSQDPREQTVPAGPHNLGFDYVIENDPDKPIMAWYGGLVTFSGLAGGYGNRIIIETDVRYHFDGQDRVVFTAYGHNAQNFVTEGEVVEAGDKIGEMGGTGSGGQATYPEHIDLRIWIVVNGDKIDLSPNVLERQLNSQQQAPTGQGPSGQSPAQQTGSENEEADPASEGATPTPEPELEPDSTGNEPPSNEETIEAPTPDNEEVEDNVIDKNETETTEPEEKKSVSEQQNEASTEINEEQKRLGKVNAPEGLWILKDAKHAYSDHEERKTLLLIQDGSEVIIINELSNEKGQWFEVGYDYKGHLVTGFVPRSFVINSNSQ